MSNRGGKREGSGRKPVWTPEEKRLREKFYRRVRIGYKGKKYTREQAEADFVKALATLRLKTPTPTDIEGTTANDRLMALLAEQEAYEDELDMLERELVISLEELGVPTGQENENAPYSGRDNLESLLKGAKAGAFGLGRRNKTFRVAPMEPTD
jgi:hypothetical protein